ncbi:MAG: class I SAM-dependent methyltransferase [Deltaproteobacteria bacterium]|nr:class I SAM-dependent methyltransferase [Deltaproteobacteria bacterium]
MTRPSGGQTLWVVAEDGGSRSGSDGRTAAAPALDLGALAAVSETLFFPLYARAVESRHPRTVLPDPEAERLTRALDPHFVASPKLLHRKLAARKLPAKLPLSLAMRTRYFDRVTRAFLEAHPGGSVVTLGCGLCTRRARLDNGRALWVDLDLPAVMALRRNLIAENPRVTSIDRSVLDLAWLDALPAAPGAARLFLAEGLFMYLPADGVQSLVQALAGRFPGSELVAEVFARSWVPRMDFRWLRWKFQKQLFLDPSVRFISGIAEGRELEGWAPGVRLLEEWTYFDDDEPRLGLMRLFGRIQSYRRLQWAVRLALGPADR